MAKKKRDNDPNKKVEKKSNSYRSVEVPGAVSDLNAFKVAVDHRIWMAENRYPDLTPYGSDYKFNMNVVRSIMLEKADLHPEELRPHIYRFHKEWQDRKKLATKYEALSLRKVIKGEKQPLFLSHKVESQSALTENKAWIIKAMGDEWKTPTDIYGIICKDERFTHITIDDLKEFYSAHAVEIDGKRRKKELSFEDLKIGTKRGRLNILAEMHHDMMEIYRQNKAIPYAKEVRAIIKQAKEEVEGNELKIAIDGTLDVRMTLESTARRGEIIDALTLNQIIIARAAARLGVDALYMQNRLTTSMYSRFNGFTENEDMLSETPEFPSALVYDFKKIEQAQPQIELEAREAKDGTIYEMPESKKKEARDIKSLLLESLKEDMEKFK